MSVEPVELATLDEDGLAREPTPLVFIEGWAAGTSAKIFNGLDDLLNERKPPAAQSRRMLVIKCGCYSSLWDRAIEIYYALKGGRCDYGEAHSREHGHARYGKTHAEGLYINWSESYPLHFAGHSFGGVTIFYLQQMLGTVLPGSATMMKSIVPISSPLRGTPLAAAFGQLEGSGGQKRFSLGWFMSLSIYIANAAKVIAPDLYDFGGDHWTSTDEKERDAKYGMVESFSQYLTGRSVGLNADSAAYDMLPSSMSQHNEGAALTEHTFYRSCVAFQVAEMLYFPPLAYCQRIIASSASTDYPGDPDWATSDGVIPSKSQMHPGDCHETTVRTVLQNGPCCIDQSSAYTFLLRSNRRTNLRRSQASGM